MCIVYRNPLVLLRNVLKGVGHENSDVRSSALCTLNKLLLEYKVNTGVINMCLYGHYKKITTI